MKKNLKNIALAFLFLLLIYYILIIFTNIFRQTEYDRTHIVGIENEKELDMVYIGGSETFVYWQPVKAWKEHGFTSYSYSVNGLIFSNIKNMIQNIEKKQSPDLYVIGVRSFLLWDENGNEGSLRRVTDSWELFSPIRLKMIHEYCELYDIEWKERLSYYLDIIKYHNNDEALKNPDNWLYAKHNVANYKGWEWIDAYQYLEEPKNFQSEVRVELSLKQKETIVNLLEYCRKKELNVLFVVSPFQITKEEQEIFNSVEDIITDYGYELLNANDYYEEMTLDFSTDFYNARHVNVFGAEKYTDFLGDYIMEKYTIPIQDYKRNSESWEKEYNEFINRELAYKEKIHQIMEEDLRGFEIAKQLIKTDDIMEWYSMTHSSRYTLFVYDNLLDDYEISNNSSVDLLLKEWNINRKGKNVLIMSDGITSISEKVEENMLLAGSCGKDKDYNGVIYEISEESFVIGQEEYYIDSESIQIVSVDNNLNRVVDVIHIIRNAESGEYILDRR